MNTSTGLRYSERKRLDETGSLGDLVGSTIPDALGRSVQHLLSEACSESSNVRRLFLQRLLSLQKEETGSYLTSDKFVSQLCHSAEVDRFLDFVERAVAVSHTTRSVAGHASPLCPDLENRLNRAFMRHAFAYELAHGQIIPVLSPALTAEVTRPALLRTRQPGWEKVEERFVHALRQHREGDYDGALHEAGAAVEAALKAAGLPGKTFSELISSFKKSNLAPGYASSLPEKIAALLNVSSAARNVDSKAHGQSPGKSPVSAPVSGLAVHLSGAFIVFLQEQLAHGS